MNVYRCIPAMTMTLALAACGAAPNDATGESTEQALGATSPAPSPDACIALTTYDPAAASPVVALSNGYFTVTSLEWQKRGSTRATHARTSGKWYWEVALLPMVDQSSSPDQPMIGIGTAAEPLESWIGVDANGWSYFPHMGGRFHNAGTVGWSPYATTAGPGDFIGVALDIDDHTLTFYKNGVTLGMAFRDIPAGVPLFPMIGASDQPFTATTRFAAPFNYPIPPGYAAFDSL
jgi:hypothetical protein